MKLSLSRRGFLLAAIAGACLHPISLNAANVIIGSGADTSYFVLQSSNLGITTYEVKYNYSATALQDGYTLLAKIIAAVPSLNISLTNGGTMLMPNYFITEITSGTVTETNSNAPPDYTPYWAHWVSGGAAGFPAATPVASGTWSFGSGISAPYRLIMPGSWDALYFSDGSAGPSVSPVPEVSSTALLALGSWVIFKRRRTPR